MIQEIKDIKLIKMACFFCARDEKQPAETLDLSTLRYEARF